MTVARHLSVLIVLAMFGGLPASATADQDNDGSRRLKVLTRNLYVGSSFAPAINATSPQEFIQGVTTIWGNIRTNDFPARAEAVADEIATGKPDVIGLQEASLIQTRPLTSASSTVAYDYL